MHKIDADGCQFGDPLMVGFQSIEIAPLGMLLDAYVNWNHADSLREQANKLYQRA
jgi:hypothetical protein